MTTTVTASTAIEARSLITKHIYTYNQALANCKSVAEMQVPTMDVLNEFVRVIFPEQLANVVTKAIPNVQKTPAPAPVAVETKKPKSRQSSPTMQVTNKKKQEKKEVSDSDNSEISEDNKADTKSSDELSDDSICLEQGAPMEGKDIPPLIKKLTSSAFKKSKQFKLEAAKLSAMREEQVKLTQKYQAHTKMNLKQTFVDEVSTQITQIHQKEKDVRNTKTEVLLKVKDFLQTSIFKIENETIFKDESEDESKTQFELRLTEPCAPIEKEQDIKCPPRAEVSLKNSFTALDQADDHCEFNFIFQDGQRTNLKSEREMKFQQIKMTSPHQVKKIVIWFQEKHNLCLGFQFFDRNDSVVFQTKGNFFNAEKNKFQETVLAEGESIVGLKARKYDDNRAYFCDLQFALARKI